MVEPHDPRPSQGASAQWEAPVLPTPEALREYERIVPGCSKKLLEQFQSELIHRRHLELQLNKLARRSSLYLDIVIFLISLTSQAIGMFFTYDDNLVVGGTFFFVGALISLCLLIYARRERAVSARELNLSGQDRI
jgi:uncharacterized membrane protein